jgi:hypothetical protein
LIYINCGQKILAVSGGSDTAVGVALIYAVPRNAAYNVLLKGP